MHSLLWVMQDLYHQRHQPYDIPQHPIPRQYCGRFSLAVLPSMRCPFGQRLGSNCSHESSQVTLACGEGVQGFISSYHNNRESILFAVDPY